jgi:hypothetical protein
MMDILKVPNPEKWELLDYFCLLCVYITLPCVRFIHGLNNMDHTGVVEDQEDTVEYALFLFIIVQAMHIFPILQVTSINTAICFFDRWLVKNSSSTSSAESNEITNTRLSARTGRDVDEDGNKWTHAQGTMSFTTERVRNGNEGPDTVRYNVTRSYIVLIHRPDEGGGNDIDDNNEDSEEISESQKWTRREHYTSGLPAWMKRVGLDEKNNNVVARFPMRVLKRDPAFAVVCNADSSIRHSSQILCPTRARLRRFCSLFLFVGAAVGQGFLISHLPLTPIEMFCFV